MIKAALPKKSRLLFIIGAIVLLASCSRMNYFPSGNSQRGLASWYGPEFHGKVTSNKEIYDMYDLTAAHPTLPFGTYVRVTNLDNGKSVVVRINDRGPFAKGRIIDLSYAAATKLGMSGSGVVPVVIEVLKKYSPKKSSQEYFVQVGAFVTKKNAKSLKKELAGRYRHVLISVLRTSSQTYYRVRIKARNMEAAEKIARKLLKEGYEARVFEEQHSP
jgi:rare lipoprotein A